MSLDDTLELDAIIQEWSSPDSVITDSDNQFNMSGIQTNTGILNPKNAGEHKITVNGRDLTIKVTNPSTIPNSGADNQWEYTAGSGSTITDTIGSLDINYNNTINWVTGAGSGDTFADLSGSNGADLGSSTRSDWLHFVSKQKGTLFAWIKPDELSGSNGNTLFDCNGFSNNNRGFIWALDDSGSDNIRFYMDDGNQTMINIIDGDLKIDEWSAIAVSLDGNDFNLYVANSANNYTVTSVNNKSVPNDTGSGDLYTNVLKSLKSSGGEQFNGGFDISFKDSVGWEKSEIQAFVDNSKYLYGI